MPSLSNYSQQEQEVSFWLLGSFNFLFGKTNGVSIWPPLTCDTLKKFFAPIVALWSYANMFTQTVHKNILICSVVAMVTNWCILLLGFSALLPVNYFKTLVVCNELQFWVSFCFLWEKKKRECIVFETTLPINLLGKPVQCILFHLGSLHRYNFQLVSEADFASTSIFMDVAQLLELNRFRRNKSF